MTLFNPPPVGSIPYDGVTVEEALDQRTFSLVFERGISSSQNLFMASGLLPANIVALRMTFDATIVGLSLEIQRTFTLPADTDVEIYKNADIAGSTPPEGNAIVDETFLAASTGGIAVLDVDVDENDTIGPYIRSVGQVRYPRVVLYMRRR